MKFRSKFALSVAAFTLAAGPALAQQAPIATYNTDVFQYWHLNGEALKDHLPPLDAKGEAALHDYAYSLALQAALWGIAPTTFYAWRYNDALKTDAHAAPGDIWRMSDISTPELSEKAGYVTPNVNTVYGFGFMDLGSEPTILTVPNSHGRYYMVEILDAYTNAFAYAGGVATGYDGGTFALDWPELEGRLAGRRPAHLFADAMGRAAAPRAHQEPRRPDRRERRAGGDHHAAAVEISGNAGAAPPPNTTTRLQISPIRSCPSAPISTRTRCSSGTSCPTRSTRTRRRNPRSKRCCPCSRRLASNWARSGIAPRCIPVVLAAMKEAAANIGMKTLVDIPPGKIRNGWVWMWPSTGQFPHRLFHPGADRPLGPEREYAGRSRLYRRLAGQREQAADGGKEIYGDHEPPPFKEPAFWSATMYDYDNNYTIENPINRYSLGSDDPLKLNADGTVTLYLQSTSPGHDKEANWLPTPASGRWYINLRAYAPGQRTIESAFDSNVYAPGPIVEVK